MKTQHKKPSRPPYNQTEAQATPGHYSLDWKPIVAWHLGDIINHMELDTSHPQVQQVRDYLDNLTEDEEFLLDEQLDQLADQHQQPLNKALILMSADVFQELVRMAEAKG